MSEKELKAVSEKLDRENERHAGRVSDILGDGAQDWLPCPLCQDNIAGFILPVEQPEEVVARVRPVIGLPDLSDFKNSEDARRCDKCNGRGVVLSGSLVQGNEAIKCRTCNGSGYIGVPSPTGELRAVEPVVEPGDAPLIDGVNPDDPAVAELRMRGFTVIPPMQITGTP